MAGAWIDLAGKVAAVTGAASGIGREAARGLAEVGATVLVLDRDEAGARAVADEIGGHARAFDVTDVDAWAATGDWIAERFGRLDVMVNSAGVALKDSPGEWSREIYRRTFAINVEGVLNGMACALRFMREQGRGSIVNISSCASLGGSVLMASYGASKAAVENYTKSAALQAVQAGHDIRVNSVHPGVIDTQLAQDLYAIYSHVGPPEVAEKLFTSGRPGRPQEVADLIVFLASERASYISGASIVIDRAANA